uniref:POP1 domain-containing protein n=1 Tax=Panagrellus redivivus TaxID=6233 RepID=A0A7E4VB29_PANRE
MNRHKGEKPENTRQSVAKPYRSQAKALKSDGNRAAVSEKHGATQLAQKATTTTRITADEWMDLKWGISWPDRRKTRISSYEEANNRSKSRRQEWGRHWGTAIPPEKKIRTEAVILRGEVDGKCFSTATLLNLEYGLPDEGDCQIERWQIRSHISVASS